MAVDLILSFDSEDYETPAADDAEKIWAAMLSRYGLRGCFCVVGEEARALRDRGRRDVLAALAQHEVAYHSNLHSVHPTHAEYLDTMGWAEGVQAVLAGEAAGMGDVRSLLGQHPSAYCKPGSSWGPQEDICLSPAEQFGALVWGAAHVAEYGGLPLEVPISALLGPAALPVDAHEGSREVAAGSAATTLREAGTATALTGMLPSMVGGLTPATVMRLAAAYLLAADAAGARPADQDTLVVPAGQQEPVLAQRPDIVDYPFEGWSIHRSDFRGDHVRVMARLQAWTAKPAHRAR